MNYGNIKPYSVENGEGIRVSLFVSGCRNCCKGCFSKQTWDFSYGNEFTTETLNYIIEILDKPYIKGITILGGEPLEPENQKEVLKIVEEIKQKFPDKSIWLYTGFQFEKIFDAGCHSRCNTDIARKIVENVDILVDGKFEEEKKNLSLKFRGSENQRIIDVKDTIKSRKIVIAERFL